jgi:putative two-component system response regulator
LQIKSQQDELKAYGKSLELLVAERTQELADSRLDVLWRLGKAAEYPDEDTGQHIVRVSLYSLTLAEALGFERQTSENLFLTSPLHDAGKIGIPDGILLKPGKLNEIECAVMQRHCEIGAQILCDESLGMRSYLQLQGRKGDIDHQTVPILQTAATVAMSHHERWDGAGYPRGLAGETIPLEGRIVALADVYDALSSKRPYKEAFPEEDMVATLKCEAGRHFDPAVHAAFERVAETFREIRHTYTDERIHETTFLHA